MCWVFWPKDGIRALAELRAEQRCQSQKRGEGSAAVVLEMRFPSNEASVIGLHGMEPSDEP